MPHTQHVTTPLPLSTCVQDTHHQDIFRSKLRQLIHNRGNPLLLHHGADGDPALLFQRVDGSSAAAGGDLADRIEVLALDVVLAQNVLLRG